jgi:dynein heavy chain
MLNDDAVKDRHWQRILEETGKEGAMEINTKTMSLTKVFELELSKYEEVVTEICKEAMEEAKIETLLREIEETWKKQNFELYPYEKNGITVCYTLGTKPLEETQVVLEENLLILQTLAANKHVRSAAKRVGQWDKDLNRIAETIAVWLQVQRQWAYLEKIFSFDDIKMQLPDEAKKFGKTDGAYKKLMEATARQS